MIVLTLPHPPSINHYYARQDKRTYLTPAARSFRSDVANAVRGLTFPGEWSVNRLCMLAVRVVLNAPTGRRHDIDNGLKALLDALTKAHVWADDSQVKVLLVMVGEPVEKGSVTITIASLNEVETVWRKM